MSLNELVYKQIEANDENVGGEGINLSNTPLGLPILQSNSISGYRKSN